MEAKTFILTNTKTWSRQVRVYVMNKNKKYEERQLPFSTEHVVSSKQRNTRGHQVPAQYTTADPIIIEAIYRDSAYGKDFVEKGDPEGKKKQASIIVTDVDKDLAALRSLFKQVNLTMDESLPFEVLKQQYALHVEALSGSKMKESTATEIPHVPVDVKASLVQGMAAARQKYEDEYGDPIPDIVENDLAFLDGLSVPGFDAQKYIETKMAEADRQDGEKDNSKDVKKDNAPSADDKDALHKAYFEKTGKNVPNMKSNDLAWIKAKLEE